MTSWVSSDIHFNHINIIKYCPASRGQFRDVDEMNETIIQNFNEHVAPDDTLYLLGDITFGSIETGYKLFQRLNGKKILVLGNHDVKFKAYLDTQSDHGVECHEYLEVKEPASGQHICMFHFPIDSWNNMGRGSIHLHGHLHSPHQPDLPARRRFDVGVDGNFMRPHNLNSLVNYLRKVPKPTYD